MTGTQPIIEQTNAVFPNLEVDLQDDRPDRSIRSRVIGRFPLTLLRAPATAVEAIGRRSVAAGLGNYLKLIWQRRGRMRYEDSNRSFDVDAGDLVLTSMGSDYHLELLEGHEALILAFDPADNPGWAGMARDTLALPIGASAGISASGSGVHALLSSPASDRTGELAARAMVDLALLSARQNEQGTAAPEPPLLARAGLQVVRNIADPSYGPTRLARDLGMSRRTLYTRMGALGASPAAFISRIRLDRARQDVLQGDGRSLLTIALANGFPDGSSLSRAFRIAFGQPPSALRARL